MKNKKARYFKWLMPGEREWRLQNTSDPWDKPPTGDYHSFSEISKKEFNELKDNP